jgi:hypothetical protein
MSARGPTRTSQDVRLESAKWGKADLDQVAVTNRNFMSTRPRPTGGARNVSGPFSGRGDSILTLRTGGPTAALDQGSELPASSARRSAGSSHRSICSPTRSSDRLGWDTAAPGPSSRWRRAAAPAPDERRMSPGGGEVVRQILQQRERQHGGDHCGACPR